MVIVSLSKYTFIASLWVIWPFQERIYEMVRGKERLIKSNPYFPEQLNTDVNTSIAMVIVGLVLVLIINHYSAGESLPEV